MGIDAEMLVRKVSRDVVTDEWLKRLSFDLCQSIGVKHFFISDGMPPAEYERKLNAWHEAFKAHPLYAEYEAGNAGARERINADVGEPPREMLRYAINRTLTNYREDDDPEPGSVYRQDGDEVVADDGECLLELSLWGRYYGEGYERGDILTYCAIAEWLEQRIPGCEVWYGGDSSGVCVERFDAARRQALRDHLYSTSGRDYFKHDMGELRLIQPNACGLCPGGIYQGSQYGWGGNYAAFSCAGCGKQTCTRDNGKTWEAVKE